MYDKREQQLTRDSATYEEATGRIKRCSEFRTEAPLAVERKPGWVERSEK